MSASGGSAVIELEALAANDVLGPHRPQIESLWRRVFPETPEERLADVLPRHAGRGGFQFLAARLDGGPMAGFAYGYEGRPGEWWHDHVATAMTQDQQELWLAPGHFEFVELMVDPEFEGQRIGGRLHDELLASVGSPTAVLSTQQSNRRALGFYARRGWEVVVPEVRFGDGYPPFCVLGKHLA